MGACALPLTRNSLSQISTSPRKERGEVEASSELKADCAVIQRRSAASISLYSQREVFTEIPRFPLE
jgi:hypothetical protein